MWVISIYNIFEERGKASGKLDKSAAVDRQHEVTNEEYKAFVDAGGYQKREFWKEPFVKDGHTIPWEEASRPFAMPLVGPVRRRGRSALFRTARKSTRSVA